MRYMFVGIDFSGVVFHRHTQTSGVDRCGTSNMSKFDEYIIAALGWWSGGVMMAALEKCAGRPASLLLFTHGSCNRQIKFRCCLMVLMQRVAVAGFECCRFICNSSTSLLSGFLIVGLQLLAALRIGVS